MPSQAHNLQRYYNSQLSLSAQIRSVQLMLAGPTLHSSDSHLNAGLPMHPDPRLDPRVELYEHYPPLLPPLLPAYPPERLLVHPHDLHPLAPAWERPLPQHLVRRSLPHPADMPAPISRRPVDMVAPPLVSRRASSPGPSYPEPRRRPAPVRRRTEDLVAPRRKRRSGHFTQQQLHACEQVDEMDTLCDNSSCSVACVAA